MKRYAPVLIVLLGLSLMASSATQNRRYYRVVTVTNTAITAWSLEGDLTWTNATLGISYIIESTTNLGNATTSYWGAVEYGPITGLVMSSRVPQSEAPRPPPTNSMVLILGGAFLMGDSYHTDAYLTDVPAHTVQLGPFYMDSTEVTKEQWDEVANWATTNGYEFEGSATASGQPFPVTVVSWYDCIKWCNARSQKEGLPPVYFTNETHTAIYTNGRVDLSADFVNWDGSGYRLPTEAEWEKAARGVLYQNYFPWPSSVVSTNPLTDPLTYLDPTNANYSGLGTTIVASYPANAYGLFDMSGNVSEWCWDYWDYYIPPYNLTGPTNGNANSNYRVTRGSDYYFGSSGFGNELTLRCSARDVAWAPESAEAMIGFRCVRMTQ
jgi:sulfatase modifying factor 1